MGSKSRIAKDIVPIIQKCIDDNNITEYYEPFCGGCNIIDKIKCENRYANDSNHYLIDFWKQLQQGWNPLDNIVMTKELYNDIKNNSDNYADCMVALTGFCATYNAKWFGGYAGIVHTKAGTIRNYYDEAVRNVMYQVPKLKDVVFTCGDCTNFIPTNTFVYCDPPYQDTTGYKDKFNYDEYWKWVREISKTNYVLCSEYNAPDDFKCVWSKTLTTTLDNASRSKSTEKLFTYIGGLYDNYIKNTSPQMA
jgi:DNA adenine methylase